MSNDETQKIIYIYIYFIFHFFFSLSGHLFQLGELTNLFVQSTFSTVNHFILHM